MLTNKINTSVVLAVVVLAVVVLAAVVLAVVPVVVPVVVLALPRHQIILVLLRSCLSGHSVSAESQTVGFLSLPRQVDQ